MRRTAQLFGTPQQDALDYWLRGKWNMALLLMRISPRELRGCISRKLVPTFAENILQGFGPHRYALLPKPELLPTVLLDWMKRLIAG